ncbi:uncharacterized protein LOC106978596 isoform X1 [Acinonyx jubatus]|uniref:Uncharacterized protein LOC106978596 isoform X1 n=1 Tax=Acinonyx jubatus TaxID=32536 RepID=A0ABM3Q9Q1_ACIJB|nr:uncharacterized protein LOC102899183 isoform X1 [Felis catus]XP_053080655.1 uncharacterized protein LOC106978596 isoform X1 [Acinonyx jubatus]
MPRSELQFPQSSDPTILSHFLWPLPISHLPFRVLHTGEQGREKKRTWFEFAIFSGKQVAVTCYDDYVLWIWICCTFFYSKTPAA